MDISSVDATGAAAKSVTAAAAVTAPEQGKAMTSSQPVNATKEKAEPNLKQVKQMVSEMQGNLDSMNINVQYSFYGKNDSRIAIKVVNKETGHVIREIPPKEMQELHDKMDDLVGLIFNGNG